MKKVSPFKRVITFLGSLQLTVIALLVLMILIITGTLYQVDHGIYAAQQHFFKAWIVFFKGVLPFPAVKSVVAVLTINLIAAAVRKRPFTIRTAGLFIMHIGVIVLVGGSVVTSYFVQESAITLTQGQSTNTTYDFSTWNFIISVNGTKDGKHYKKVYRYPLTKLRNGKCIKLAPSPVTSTIKKVYSNCASQISSDSQSITGLVERPPAKEQGRNFPGVTFSIAAPGPNAGGVTRHLYAGSMIPESFTFGPDTIVLTLQPHSIELPMRITLSRFEVQWHPGTSKAKSFKTRLRLFAKHLDREVTIEMNRPFRYQSFTFYQMGYNGEEGNYSSTLAIVKNPLRYMPYISSLIIVVGLFLHFFIKMWFELIRIRGTSREK